MNKLFYIYNLLNDMPFNFQCVSRFIWSVERAVKVKGNKHMHKVRFQHRIYV
jgi:hypothetical protein